LIAQPKLDGSYIKLLNQLERQTLIILDRLTANAHRNELKGESLRRKKGKTNQ
jgi:hypothetical protein